MASTRKVTMRMPKTRTRTTTMRTRKTTRTTTCEKRGGSVLMHWLSDQEGYRFEPAGGRCV